MATRKTSSSRRTQKPLQFEPLEPRKVLATFLANVDGGIDYSLDYDQQICVEPLQPNSLQPNSLQPNSLPLTTTTRSPRTKLPYYPAKQPALRTTLAL